MKLSSRRVSLTANFILGGLVIVFNFGISFSTKAHQAFAENPQQFCCDEYG
jgi:hypothetical protein